MQNALLYKIRKSEFYKNCFDKSHIFFYFFMDLLYNIFNDVHIYFSYFYIY